VRPVHIIDLGCRVADVHHRYQEVHGALFGAASFRLIIDALLGKRQRAYEKCTQTLSALDEELSALETQIQEVTLVDGGRVVDRELRDVLLKYIRVLHKVITELAVIFEGLTRDEMAYREPGPDGRSDFTRDKLNYDHLLVELENLGVRLNRLVANY
jgi:hypothetical protein